MSTLEEDLRELSDLLPGLPGEAEAASHAATALATATTPLLAEVAALHDSAHEAVGVTSQLGQAFAKHASELEEQLRTALTEANASWGAARQAIEHAAEETFASALGMTQAKTALESALETGAAGLNGNIADGDAALARLQHVAATAKQGVHDASAAVHTEAVGVHGILAMVAELNAATDALQARITELQGQIAASAGHLHEALVKKTHDVGEAMQQALATLGAELDDQRSLTHDHLHDGVAKPLGAEGDAAHQALVSLGTSAGERDRQLVDARATFAQAFAELEESAARIPDTIHEIHEAFEKIDGL
jgi:chromosome segregation ATPase